MGKLAACLCLALWLPFGSVQADAPYEVKMFSRETLSPLKFDLSDGDWRWLGIKREVRIGVYAPENPPFDIVPEPGTYEGISADYSLLVSRYLGLGTRVLRYPNRTAALTALRNGEVDMLVDDAGERLFDAAGYLSSTPFMPDHPALVSRETALSRPLAANTHARIALLRGYLSDEWVESHYPNAKITRYGSSQSALSSTAFGENDYFIGNLTVASFLIERNYANMLSVADIFPAQETGPRFLFRYDNTTLWRAVNAVLKAIPPVQHKVIFRQWSQGPDLWQFQSSLNLTDREKRWLEQHRELEVVINPLYAPFTMFDSAGQFHGISADILRLIHLRTGLNFKAQEADSVNDMFTAVNSGRGDLLAAMSYSTPRDKQLMFTRPYLFPPFVLVVRDSMNAPGEISQTMRLAITPDNQLRSWLKQHYPKVTLIEADNASVALQLVNEDKADGAVHNLIGASYMIDRYFRGELKIAARLGDAPSLISFAVRRDQPELYSILNKALADIPPRDISLIVNKWQGTPDVRLDTWTVYRSQFYWLGGIFAALVLSSLVWVYYLRREIGTRRDAQLKLQEQATFRETLFNGTPVPVYVVDRNGNIINHNQAWDTFFQQEAINLNRMALTSPLHPLAAVYPQLREMLASTSGDTLASQRYKVSNGREDRVINHYAVPFRDRTGSVAGLICSWQDITGHEYLLDALSVARERAEQANRSKSTFLATMSHEIRTPISAIIGLLELAVTSKDARGDDEPVRVAYESAQSLLGLIGDILDMAKIESGKLELNPEWVAFDELAAPVVRVFDGLARQKNLALNCHIDALHPDEIYLDPMRFRQVLSNLVSNAIKFTEQGSVDVQVKCLPERDHQVLVELVVADTGVGISEAEQKRVFSPYEQAEAGIRQSGTGLGLAICTELLAMMDGTIDLHSQPGRGTRITVRLPVAHRQQTAVPPREPIGPVAHSASLRILAVDDHPANRLLLKRQLLRLGHQVSEAENGEQALQLWREGDYDLVITDCSMPVMDGLALTRQIRAAQTRPVSILGLTANAQPEERVRCLAAGMDDCLFKPLRLPQLEALLRSIPRGIRPAKLETLLDINALRQLAQEDAKLLHGLLVATREENERDMQRAQRLLTEQNWGEMSRCLHRLAGAVQIIGAEQAEKHCRELEKYCEGEPGVDEVAKRLPRVLLSLAELNQAIEAYLAGPE